MSDLHTNSHATSTSSNSTSTSSYTTTKQGLLSNTPVNTTTVVGVVSGLGNTRFDFVILSKLDKDGNLNLLHTKPLSVEIINQVPDSLIVFTEGLSQSLCPFYEMKIELYHRLS